MLCEVVMMMCDHNHIHHPQHSTQNVGDDGGHE